MIVETAVKNKDGRYLHLEQIMGSLSSQDPSSVKNETRTVTLVFDQHIELFPLSVLNSWLSQQVIALMGPGFGALARYQGHRLGFMMMSLPAEEKLKDGEKLYIDPEHHLWHGANGLAGRLAMQDRCSLDLAAFLASVSEDKRLHPCVHAVVDYLYDPQVKRF